MTIKLLSPTSHVHKPQQLEQKSLRSLSGRRIGFVFNQHGTTLAFWKALEQAVEGRFEASSLSRVYKPSVWAPAPMPAVEKLAAETDLAIVGVGA